MLFFMKWTIFLLSLTIACSWALESDPGIVSSPDKKPAIWKVYGVRKAEAIDSKNIRLTIGHATNHGVLGKFNSYRIVSEEDPYYAYNRFVKPLKATVLNKGHEKELSVNEDEKQVFNRHLVALQLPKEMEEGKRYSVVCLGVDGLMVSSACTAATLIYHASRLVKPQDVQTDIKALTVMGLRGADPVGGDIIRLEFGATYFPEEGNHLIHYEITINGKKSNVLNMGRRSRIDAYLPVGWPFKTIMMHEVFLQLDQPLSDGADIKVKVSPKVCSGANETGFTFHSRRTFSGSIKVNQVGYLAELPLKRAYLGRWLGSFPDKNAVNPKDENKKIVIDAKSFYNAASGKPADNGNATVAPFALSFAKPPVFYLIDAESGAEVYRGTAVLGHNGLEMDGKVNHSAENVYYLDFNDFSKPGRYFISVDGVGRSLEFTIDDDVYQSAFKIASLGVFLQRCGIELGPPYTSWRRIACHADGIIETSQERINSKGFIDPKSQVTIENPQRQSIPKRIAASGGHHDAGDYNPRSHIDVAQNLMDAYELAPQKFFDGQLDIPENDNGIPDILDEALWALKLWLGLQDKDGGVFHGTESDGDPNFIQTVELDPKGDFAWAKDCKASFLFAGTFAQTARILKSLGQSQTAEDYLDRARRAYEWGCLNKPNAKDMKAYGDYAITSRAYAAAQLYHTTGLDTYHQDFKDLTPWLQAPSAKMIADDHSYDLSLAAYAYSMIPDDKADKSLKDAVIRAIEEEVQMYISGSEQMAYKFIRHPLAPITWGTGAYEHFLVPVWHAWGMTRDVKKRNEYFEWMVRTADNTLGANPMNISWIVGLGERTVRAPLHNSRYNPSGMCMPGQQVQGPNKNGEGYNYTSSVYPPHDNSFAIMHAFVDCHWAIAMDEGMVKTQAETMAAFGLLLKDKSK